mmetsp:Transcript_32897/g.94329  ORF Transcript_32897/g.94329 Transcript_32897/m.94329 type:complete len:336 (-) Transcript_32897:385-1392(-)
MHRWRPFLFLIYALLLFRKLCAQPALSAGSTLASSSPCSSVTTSTKGSPLSMTPFACSPISVMLWARTSTSRVLPLWPSTLTTTPTGSARTSSPTSSGLPPGTLPSSPRSASPGPASPSTSGGCGRDGLRPLCAGRPLPFCCRCRQDLKKYSSAQKNYVQSKNDGPRTMKELSPLSRPLPRKMTRVVALCLPPALCRRRPLAPLLAVLRAQFSPTPLWVTSRNPPASGFPSSSPTRTTSALARTHLCSSPLHASSVTKSLWCFRSSTVTTGGPWWPRLGGRRWRLRRLHPPAARRLCPVSAGSRGLPLLQALLNFTLIFFLPLPRRVRRSRQRTC